MSLERAQEYRQRLEALITAGVGITEIRRTLGFGHAALYDMIRFLGLPKPVDQRTRRTVTRPHSRA